MISDDILQELNNETYPSVYKKIFAYTQMKLSKLAWRHQHEGTTKGQQARDFVHQAITDTLKGIRTWNKTKNPTIMDHLKDVIDSFLSNAINSSDNIKRSNLTPSELEKSYTKPLYYNEPTPEELLIADDMKEAIEEAICAADDTIGLEVYMAIANKHLKPKEIHIETGIAIKEINNAQKRIRRIARNILNTVKHG